MGGREIGLLCEGCVVDTLIPDTIKLLGKIDFDDTQEVYLPDA